MSNNTKCNIPPVIVIENVQVAVFPTSSIAVHITDVLVWTRVPICGLQLTSGDGCVTSVAVGAGTLTLVVETMLSEQVMTGSTESVEQLY